MESVGDGDHGVSGLQVERYLIVNHAGEKPQRDSLDGQGLDAAAAGDDRLRLPCARYRQLHFVRHPKAINGRQEPRFDFVRQQRRIHASQHIGGPAPRRRRIAHQAAGQRRVQRGGHAFAADVAVEDAERVFRDVKIVEVSRNFRGGIVARRDLDSRIAPLAARQQMLLQDARRREVSLHAFLVACFFFIQPRIFDRRRDLRSEQVERMHVGPAEVGVRAALQVEHADHFVFQDQRHGHFRLDSRRRGDIARILGRIFHQHGLPQLGGAADQSLACFDVAPMNPLVEAHAEIVLQQAVAGLAQIDRQNVVANQRPQQRGDFAQQLFEMEDM